MFRNATKKASTNSINSLDEDKKKGNILSLAKKEKDIKDIINNNREKDIQNSLKIKFRPYSPLVKRREKKSITLPTNKHTCISNNTNNKDNNLVSLPYHFSNINVNNNILSPRANGNNYSGIKNLYSFEISGLDNLPRKKSKNIFKENFKSCNRNLPVVKTRKDTFGIPIIKGSKNHNIIFKDKLNEEYDLVEIINVESYKEDNIQDDFEYREDGDEDSP